MIGDILALTLCLSFVASIVALTIDMATHDDNPSHVYDEER